MQDAQKAAFSPAQPWRAKTCLVPGKAAASEGERRYVPHLVWAVRPFIDLGERKIPSSVSDLPETPIQR